MIVIYMYSGENSLEWSVLSFFWSQVVLTILFTQETTTEINEQKIERSMNIRSIDKKPK